MMGRGALRRGRRRGRRRTMLVMSALNKRKDDDEGYDNNPQESYNEPEEPAFSDDDADQLEKLAELKEKGIITEEEFNKKKKQILGL